MLKSTIPAAVQAELKRQFNQELSAAHAYLAMSVWCADRNLKGFAGYFRKQEAEEREHAQKLITHLVDRNTPAELAAIAAPKQDFDSLPALAQAVQAMERANTQDIHTVYEAALAAKDYAAQVLMHWFIQEQVEEEAWASELVERVKAANCAGGLSDLDRHIERLLARDEAEKE